MRNLPNNYMTQTEQDFLFKFNKLFSNNNIQKLVLVFLMYIFYMNISFSQDCVPCSTLGYETGFNVYMTDNSDWETYYDQDITRSLVPGCNTHFSANWSIINTMSCNWRYQVVLHLSAEMLPEISASDMFNDFVYTGPPLLFDGIISIGGKATRKLIFDVTVPAGQTAPIEFPFDIIPIGDYVFPNEITRTFYITPYTNSNFTDLCDDLTATTQQSFVISGAGAIIRGSTNISDVASTLNVENYGIILLNSASSNNPPTLTFDIPTTIERSLLLDPGSKIIVDNGGVNALHGVDIFTCYQMANSIEVQPGSTLNVDGSNISNFVYAIDAKPGSTIDLSNNYFRRNFIGLNLQMSNNPFKVTINNLIGNTFNGEYCKQTFVGSPENIHDGQHAFAGVRAHSFIDLNIRRKNYFNDLEYGIYTTNTSANVYDQEFTDIFGSSPTGGSGIYMRSKGFNTAHIGALFFTGRNKFTGCNYGIYLDGMNGDIVNNSIDVGNIFNAGIGIYWRNSTLKSLKITDNEIRSYFDGIISYHNEPLIQNSNISRNKVHRTGVFGGILNPQAAIRASESFQSPNSLPFGGWKIDNNTIDCDNGQGVGIVYWGGTTGAIINNTINNHKPLWYMGIWTQNSSLSTFAGNTIGQELNGGIGLSGGVAGIFSQSGWSNTFDCNCIDNTSNGIQFFDLADFSDKVKGNNLNTHLTGLKLEHNAFIGKQHHTGNLWDLGEIPSGDFGAVNSNTSVPVIELSKFFVDQNENASFNPPADPDGVWFIDDPDPSLSYSCANGCKFAFPTPEPYIPEDCNPTDIDVSIANNDFLTENYQDEMRWKAGFRLYRRMLRCPQLATYDSHFSSFKAANDSTSIGKLATVKEELSTLFELPIGITWTSISAITDSLLELQGLIAEFDSIRSLATAYINETAYNAVLQDRIKLQNIVDSIYNTLDVARIQKAQNLLIRNETINSTLAPAINQQIVNSIVLKMAMEDTLSLADTTALWSIAVQCPLEGGDAVYEARSIMVYDSLNFNENDIELCAVSGEKPLTENITSNLDLQNKAKIVILPNPNNGDFRVFVQEEGCRIRLVNQLGIVESEKNLSIGINFFSGFSTGVHLAQIFDRNGRLSSIQQIVITK